MNITHNDLKDILKICYTTKSPHFIWGTTGIGKSTAVEDIARDIAKNEGLELAKDSDSVDTFGFIDVRISQLEPSDLKGLPDIDRANQVTKWLIANWLPKEKDSKGVLFFDELNLSPPSIQASAYQLILDRKIGDYELPKGWIIVSAGNRVEDGCNVFDMSSALCNRFSHSTLEIPSKDAWCNWGLKNDIDNRILSFIQFKPSALFNFDRKNKDKAFPTPRSWAVCSKQIKGQTNKNLLNILISMNVGEATAIEFMAFLRLESKIDLADILKNPKKIAEITEIDLKYVLLGTLAEQYRKDKKILEKSFVLCEHLEAEFSVLLLRFLRAINETHFKKIIVTDKKGMDLLKKYADILK